MCNGVPPAAPRQKYTHYQHVAARGGEGEGGGGGVQDAAAEVNDLCCFGVQWFVFKEVKAAITSGKQLNKKIYLLCLLINRESFFTTLKAL